MQHRINVAGIAATPAAAAAPLRHEGSRTAPASTAAVVRRKALPRGTESDQGPRRLAKSALPAVPGLLPPRRCREEAARRRGRWPTGSAAGRCAAKRRAAPRRAARSRQPSGAGQRREPEPSNEDGATQDAEQGERRSVDGAKAPTTEAQDGRGSGAEHSAERARRPARVA